MTNPVFLNNVSHHDLKVIPSYSAELGDNVASVLAFPTEFVELQKEYPILIRKNSETKTFQATALLGFNKEENLYLDPTCRSGWAANYIPAAIAKGPFLIGMQSQDEGSSDAPVVHIDLDHPKVSEQDGYPLFLEHGGTSPYLERITSVLKVIHEGIATQDVMFSAFSELGLIEPVAIDIDLNNGEKRQLVGNYTINEEKLASLSGDKLEQLSKRGFLPLAYAVIASMTNIRKLIEIKNGRER
ncbi:SapC family protein [Marinimicrobium sp. LS-A18]|uniref:SapC family protein n=1 Tax=Marinimicrobium sp. LS-A18 TaxID=1381596 RepID=UPI000464808C|nr:SapC family protein [Marinimicrobium sp. LS-A18]